MSLEPLDAELREGSSPAMKSMSPTPRSLRPAAALRVFATALLIAFCSTPAFAAGGGGDPVKEAIYQGINLLILVGVIVYFGGGPIRDFFGGRRNDIQSNLDEATSLLTQAEQRNAELQRRLVDLSSEVEEIKENAGKRAEEEAERILADARSTADRIRSDAQAAVDQELRRAQTELRQEAAELALEMAGRKLSDSVTDADRERLMDEFITRVEPTGAAGGANG